jgi:hypothetical protein
MRRRAILAAVAAFGLFVPNAGADELVRHIGFLVPSGGIRRARLWSKRLYPIAA